MMARSSSSITPERLASCMMIWSSSAVTLGRETPWAPNSRNSTSVERSSTHTSGAVALALKHKRPAWTVHAVDQSAKALTVAQANAQRLQLEVVFTQSDWFAQVHGSFELIVSNPPYIAQGDPHLPGLVHEPQSALVSGPQGLNDLQAIIAQAPSYLVPGGWLLLEHGYDQATAVRELLLQKGFTQVQSRNDLAGIARCSGGMRSEVK